jgi:hypothetical protein
MRTYYPARDGHPSMFDIEDGPSAVAGATKLHRSFVGQPPPPGRATHGRRDRFGPGDANRGKAPAKISASPGRRPE